MRKALQLLSVFLMVSGWQCAAQPSQFSRQDGQSARHLEIEANVTALMSQMTLQEKLGQLQTLHAIRATGEYLPEHLDFARRGLLGSTYHVRGAKIANELQTAALSARLKIPVLLAFDVIHGYRTLFPIPLGETASWDLEAAERSAAIAAAEARSAGLHWTFAPMVDLARDPRWGRVMEGAGEDVYLGRQMAKARTQGFQGSDYSQKDKIMACAKHFAAYGAAEGGRDYNTADLSERSLREAYLPPFEAAVQAGVASIMTGFNEINGIPATANDWLLKTILREEWKFDGLVVSDHNSVVEMINHGLVEGDPEAAMYALNAGTDMEMFSQTYLNHGEELVRSGKVSLATVDAAVRNVLRQKYRVGLFDNPWASEEFETATLKKPEFLQAAREIAGKSFVLLKNERNTLPIDLTKVTEIAVIGALADDRPNSLDWWPGDAKEIDVVTMLQGIRAKVTATRPAVTVTFTKGCESGWNCKNDSGFSEAKTAAARADITVIVVGETREVYAQQHVVSGEAGSLTNINLSGLQLDLVKVIAETRKPYVVVLKNGRPLTIEWLDENAPAILVTWHAGTMGGHAVADVLFGDVNPSGKLPMSFPRNVGQIPVYYNYKNTGRPFNASVEGDQATYRDSLPTPLYPFGFGLSYTTFSYGKLTLSSNRIRADENLTVSVEVENTGLRAGAEVVQLYLHDVAASVTRPMRQLRGFRKLTLNPGEKRPVDFTLSREDFGFLNRAFRWIVEAGRFEVYIGGSSEATLSATFSVTTTEVAPPAPGLITTAAPPVIQTTAGAAHTLHSFAVVVFAMASSYFYV